MTNNNKNSNGPKTDEGKAISSRNSTTHGLTARRWLDINEQSLYDETVKNLIVDFDPQSSIENILISKMAECIVRLMRTQKVENAMFDLASSEAGHPEESIKSLDNGSDKLTQAVCDTAFSNCKFNPDEFRKKRVSLDEIDRQNLSNITGWTYVEDNMPITADYIIKRCTNAKLNLFDFISRETNQSKNRIVRIIVEGKDNSDEEMSLSIEGIVEDAHKISSTSLQKYFDKLVHSLAKDLQVQFIPQDLEQRIQQIKDAAMPDPQKLSLIQRYRTADERQFSKTLKELIGLLQMRKNI